MKNPSLSLAESLTHTVIPSVSAAQAQQQLPYPTLGGFIQPPIPEAAYGSEGEPAAAGAMLSIHSSSGLECSSFPQGYVAQQPPALHGSFSSLVGGSQQQQLLPHHSYASYVPVSSAHGRLSLGSGPVSASSSSAFVVSLPPPVRQESRPLLAGTLPLMGGETHSLRQPIMSSTAQPSAALYPPPGGLLPFMMMSGTLPQGSSSPYHPFTAQPAHPLSAQQRIYLQQQQQQRVGGGVPGSPVSPPPTLLDHHRLSPSNLVAGACLGSNSNPTPLLHHQLAYQQQLAAQQQQQQQQSLYNHYNTFSGYPGGSAGGLGLQAAFNHPPNTGLSGLQTMLGGHLQLQVGGMGVPFLPTHNVGGAPVLGLSSHHLTAPGSLTNGGLAMNSLANGGSGMNSLASGGPGVNSLATGGPGMNPLAAGGPGMNSLATGGPGMNSLASGGPGMNLPNGGPVMNSLANGVPGMNSLTGSYHENNENPGVAEQADLGKQQS
jgi:hypothetical protein